jgi:hypothetical protein
VFIDQVAMFDYAFDSGDHAAAHNGGFASDYDGMNPVHYFPFEGDADDLGSDPVTLSEVGTLASFGDGVGV